MNIKKKVLGMVVVATLAFSGQASAISGSGGGELFLVASNSSGATFVATLGQSVVDFAGTATLSPFDLSGSAWTSFTTGANASLLSSVTYQVLGVDTDSSKLVTSMNPLISSAGSNQMLVNTFDSASPDTGAIYQFMQLNNADVTGALSSKYIAYSGTAAGLMSEIGNNWANKLNAINTAQALGSNLYFASLAEGTSSIAVTNYSGVWNLDSAGALSYTVAAVPEADASLMMLAGVLAMGAVAKRRKSV